MDGFDTHFDLKSFLGLKFNEIGVALRSFRDELVNLGLWNGITMVVSSEMGRTITPNTSSGTGENQSLLARLLVFLYIFLNQRRTDRPRLGRSPFYYGRPGEIILCQLCLGLNAALIICHECNVHLIQLKGGKILGQHPDTYDSDWKYNTGVWNRRLRLLVNNLFSFQDNLY
jgi:hypothetical protein